MNITVSHWLTLSSILFGVGLYGVVRHRSSLRMIMSIELMLNSAALNFVVADYYSLIPPPIGRCFAIFIMAAAAASAAIGLAMALRYFQEHGTVEFDLSAAVERGATECGALGSGECK